MTSTETDTTAVGALLGALADAWNAGDADAYGALFTEDASYVNFLGQVAHGRTQITEGHRRLFAKMPGSRLSRGNTAGLRFLNPDSAVVVSAGPGSTLPGREPSPDRASVVSFVVVRCAGGWRFAHFQNTRVQAPPTP